MKLATKASAGAASSSAAVPSWRIAPVDDHADAVGERRGVLEVVRDEQRRQAQLGEELRELAADDAARVRIERGERLVEQQHGRVARERAGKRDSLALATRELARPRGRRGGRSGSARAARRPAHARRRPTFAAHVEVREERVLLEDEPDRAALGRQIDPGGGVEPRLARRERPSRAWAGASRRSRAARSTSPPRTARRARASRARARALPRDGRSGERGRA